MNENIENLYRQVIMDHYKNPRNKGLVGYPHVHIKNPSCGDDITIEALIENGVVKDIRQDGSGCSICCSSASVMSEVLKNQTVEKAQALIAKYYDMLKGQAVENADELDEALVFQGVSKFPARIKCATIAWKAMEKLINGEHDE
ncbi:MAG TPA: SUF system NifU family Fe-S cluster assembly protein [Acholeplasmatales bacterium]|nr:SUF system NifU family Fe-S cluster assembly protein [Acholeplasmatales bacterium]